MSFAGETNSAVTVANIVGAVQNSGNVATNNVQSDSGGQKVGATARPARRRRLHLGFLAQFLVDHGLGSPFDPEDPNLWWSPSSDDVWAPQKAYEVYPELCDAEATSLTQSQPDTLPIASPMSDETSVSSRTAKAAGGVGLSLDNESKGLSPSSTPILAEEIAPQGPLSETGSIPNVPSCSKVSSRAASPARSNDVFKGVETLRPTPREPTTRPTLSSKDLDEQKDLEDSGWDEFRRLK
jgi:hypothetical protein